MSKLFPGKVVKTNCNNTQENSTCIKAEVNLEDFGSKYIAEGDVVYRIDTTPIAQWELDWDLKQTKNSLTFLIDTIQRKEEYLISLEEAKGCSWYDKEYTETVTKIAEERLTKQKYEDTIAFCKLYLIID